MSDPVIDAYKRDIDRTLLIENGKLTVHERFLKFDAFMRGVMELREAGERARREGAAVEYQSSRSTKSGSS